MLDAANRPEHRDLSPKQIVPRLADEGVYLASESTFYRILHEETRCTIASRVARRSVARPREHVATGPCEVWSWDITYLRSAVRGAFYYLYLVEDIWSRKIVGWAVHEEESMDLAARLIDDTAIRTGLRSERTRPPLRQRRPDEGLDDARDAAASGHRAVLQPPARQ